MLNSLANSFLLHQRRKSTDILLLKKETCPVKEEEFRSWRYKMVCISYITDWWSIFLYNMYNPVSNFMFIFWHLSTFLLMKKLIIQIRARRTKDFRFTVVICSTYLVFCEHVHACIYCHMCCNVLLRGTNGFIW